jgi:hypothetical protein
VWTPQATTNRERQYQVRFDQHSDALDDAISHRACTRHDWHRSLLFRARRVRYETHEFRPNFTWSSFEGGGCPCRGLVFCAYVRPAGPGWPASEGHGVVASVQVQGCAGPREHPVVVYARSEQRRRSAAVERGAFCLGAHCHLRVDANAFSPWFMESW